MNWIKPYKQRMKNHKKYTEEQPLQTEWLRKNWNQLRTEAYHQWSRLSDLDLDEIQGNAEKLIDKLQERYRVSKEEAKASFDDFRKKAANWIDPQS